MAVLNPCSVTFRDRPSRRNAQLFSRCHCDCGGDCVVVLLSLQKEFRSSPLILFFFPERFGKCESRVTVRSPYSTSTHSPFKRWRLADDEDGTAIPFSANPLSTSNPFRFFPRTPKTIGFNPDGWFRLPATIDSATLSGNRFRRFRARSH